MTASIRILPAVAVLTALATLPASGQDLHENDRWEECSIVLDPSLDQGTWHEWVSELPTVVGFRPLASARPMGRGNVEFAVMNWGSRIDDEKDAWNDTFSHPDSTHYLTDGDALMIPGLMVRAGVSDRIDVGAYFTKNPNANYGFYGAQVQYAVTDETEAPVSVATRASLVHLFGPEDAEVGVYGLDAVVSRDFGVLSDRATLSPYMIASGYYARGQETTDKVELDDENIVTAQGTLGMALSVWAVRLGAEYSVGRVDGYSFKVAFAI